MPRKKASVDPAKDPVAYLETYLMPKALKALDRILSWKVDPGHPQWVRSFTIRRAAAGTVINGYAALKQLGIQTQNTDILGQILERIKQHDAKLTHTQRRTLEQLHARPVAPITDVEETEVEIDGEIEDGPKAVPGWPKPRR